MNPPHFLTSPWFTLLLRWTALLLAGWLAHGALRNRHARWRLVLWRGILCAGVILPWMQLVQFPGLRIPIVNEDSFSGPLGVDSATTAPSPGKPVAGLLSPRPAGAFSAPSANTSGTAPSFSSSSSDDWVGVLLGIWTLGVAYGGARLIRLQIQITRLRRGAAEPGSELCTLVNEAKAGLNLRRAVEIKISGSVVSPFVCGLWKPALILPESLALQLPRKEISALLSHEMAHLKRHDLVWCVSWRWMKAICWFHPLAWPVPAAHNLACEQEADRMAAGRMEDKYSYAALLARLALRVLALPAVETRLTLNGSSQISRRLDFLRQEESRDWGWRQSAAGACMVGLLFLAAAGCQFAKSSSSNAPAASAVEFKNTVVVVEDEEGKPVEGATILPTGFRVKGLHGADAYSWNRKLFGEPQKTLTGKDGKAIVKYPVEGIPEERESTGNLIFKVTHPEFASRFIQSYSVDSPEKPIRLTRGIHLTVSGYFGPDHQPVTEIVANLNRDNNPQDWIQTGNQALSFHKMSPGGQMIQLMGRLPSGDVVYSEYFAFPAETGKAYNFDLEMKPGIRLEGCLDDRVPRPVKNGRVLISVRPREIPAWTSYHEVEDLLKKYPDYQPWKSYRVIAEDGTFVFESVPPGGLDVVAHGDGFVSQSGGEFSSFDGIKKAAVPGFALPQAFSLVAPATRIVVPTEPSATLELTVKTKRGKPLANATVYLNPNLVRMNGIFGNLKKSSEEPFRVMAPLPDVKYSATTDNNGFVVLRDIPASTGGMEVFHPQYQVLLQEPKGWRNRYVRMAFSPGATNKYELTMEPKGTDFIGGK